MEYSTPGHMMTPGPQVTEGETLQGGLQLFVSPLGLTNGLGMEH